MKSLIIKLFLFLVPILTACDNNRYEIAAAGAPLPFVYRIDHKTGEVCAFAVWQGKLSFYGCTGGSTSASEGFMPDQPNQQRRR
jgi:hypothetical protein